MATQKKYNTFKLMLGRYALRNLLRKQKRHIVSCALKNAKTVGITFIANHPSQIEVVKQFVKSLADKGIQPCVMGYIPVKKPDDFYLSQKGFNFFSDKELDLSLRPTMPQTSEFINTKFDILIDIGSEHYFPMLYLISASEAKFKVGWANEPSPFDLTLSIPKSASQTYYFEQVTHYLTQLT
jgi:hypothetical protein